MRARGGFTLIELLVSMTVSALLVGLLVSVMARSLDFSQRSTNAMTAYGSAATAMDLVATDLASLAVTRQPYEFLQALPEPTPGLTSIPSPIVQPMRLMLLVASPEDSAQPSPSSSNSYPDSGQVRAVSYLLAWQNPVSSTVTPSPGNSVFGIYRQVASTADTFKYVLGSTDLYKSLYVNSSVANTPVPPVLSTFVTGNVVDFQLAFYANPISVGGTGNPVAGTVIQPAVVINAMSATAPLPYQKTQLQGTQILVGGAALQSTSQNYSYAVYAEVSLTVIEDSGAKLWGDGTGTGATSPVAIKQKYGHTLTRKVILRTPQ